MVIEDNSIEKNISFQSEDKTFKSRMKMSEKSDEPKKKKKETASVIVDELLDEELSQKEQREIDRQAWQWTLDVEKWIWKQIRQRNIPAHDQEDVYNLCAIEVFHLMKRYNPKYSKVSWANFGILKAMKEYESTSGVVRLPFHVLEKMSNLRKYLARADIEGESVTVERMQEVTKMKVTDLMVARERYATVTSTNKEGKNVDFSSDSLNVNATSSEFVDSGIATPEDNTVYEDQMSFFYAKLDVLTDLEIFILVLRYGLNADRVPNRDCFSQGEEYDLSKHSHGNSVKTSDVSDILEMSRERVRQIEIGAVNRIKEEV
jgi:DNA-directed RNA polymerase sigma subunit (sigma70/sigma32)